MKIIREENPNPRVKLRYGYYKDGKFAHHRDDGPAIVYGDIQYYRKYCGAWFYHGAMPDVYSQEEFEKWLKYNNF